MRDVLLYAILGIGTGTAYALTALGVVLTYKGSGVVNFSQGALAMIAAFSYADLTQGGMQKALAAGVVLAAAAVAGGLIYLLVMRPLRTSPLLAKVVVTIGLLVALVGVAQLRWGDASGEASAPTLFPIKSVRVFGVAFGVDRIYLFAITCALVVLLWALYRFTRFGIATRANAENERGAAFLGFSPEAIATANWAMGAVLAAAAGILLAPIASLDINTLTFLVLPAIAAALVGRFSSFALAAAAGMAIGVGQSELTRFWDAQGVHDALPFVIVIMAMALTGKLIPPRGTLSSGRPPLAASGQIRPVWVAVVPVVVIGLLATTSAKYEAAITTSIVIATIVLSLVVVTGYVGQVSLAPMTFAGFGAFAVSKFGHGLGIPFPLPIILGAVIAVPIGVVVGAPALRVRGINLAIVTLGAAVAVDAVLFQDISLTGGRNGSLVPSPELFGFDIGPVAHPTRFGLFAFGVLAAMMLAVSSLRANPMGRRMLAVRSNERAAAAAGISVPAVKLQAFAISAAIAAIGGGVMAYQLGAVSYTQFVPVQSLTLVTLAYIGGIASVSGALQAGVLTSGGLMYVLLNQIGGIDKYWATLTGVLLIVTVVGQPDGIAISNSRLLAAAVRHLRAGHADDGSPARAIGESV
jgi:ABC-type branched-subunit amino acid transport system permease subunit